MNTCASSAAPTAAGTEGWAPARSPANGPAPTTSGDTCRRTAQCARDERGQAAVEFALVVPVICLMVLALIDFAKGLDYWLDANHLANLGARQAAVVGNSTQPSSSFGSGISCWVRAQAQSYELRNGVEQVTLPDGTLVKIDFVAGPTGSTGQIGDPVRVTVRANYKWIPFVGGATFPIKATSTMRLERLPAGASPALNGQSC